MSWKNRIVGAGEVDPRELERHPNNYRTHPEYQLATLRGALEEIGWVKQVVVNKRSGRIIDGHARVDEAIKEGATGIPVVYVDLDPTEETKALVTFDPISEMAETEAEAYRELTESLEVENEALAEALSLANQEPELPPQEDFQPPEEDNYKEQAGLIVTVAGPDEQAQVVEEMKRRGYNARGIEV